MNTESARQQMVLQQVRTWDVFDADVLAAIGHVPRDRFVPQALQHCAYADIEVPLAHGQCMLRPSIVGRILQALEVQPADEVLEIGTGTGYLSACLAALARQVTSIDIHADFVDSAGHRLAALGVANVNVQCMDASRELPEGTFDVIAATVSVDAVDRRWLAALKPGGRLFVVIGQSPAMTATLLRQEEHGEQVTRALFETNIPPLITPLKKPAFSF